MLYTPLTLPDALEILACAKYVDDTKQFSYFLPTHWQFCYNHITFQGALCFIQDQS